jgi:hypothetical protein
MIWRLLPLIVALVLAVPSFAADVQRCAKAGGGTAFVDGRTAVASEINCDLDAIVTQVNDLDNDNIAAAAAILFSKMDQSPGLMDADIVGDYSTDDAEADNSSDPGTAESNTLATNLEEEIKQLRYKIEQLTVGTSAGAVASSAGTDTDAHWIDGPYRLGNHVYNGSFEMVNTLAIGADGDGWTRVLTPTTLAQIALVETEDGGAGNGLQIIDTAAALAGVKQTLDGLKSNTKYLLIGRVQDDTGTCRMTTTGADTNELSLTSDDSGNWQILSGTFETVADPTGTDIVISLLAVAQSDDCTFDEIGVYEINTDPVPLPSIVIEQICAVGDHVLGDNPPANFDGTAVAIAVTPPGPNYNIEVHGFAHVEFGAGNTYTAELAIDENGTDQRTAYAKETNGAAETSAHPISVHWVNRAPTPGTTYTYNLQLGDGGGVNSNYTNANGDACLTVRMSRGF